MECAEVQVLNEGMEQMVVLMRVYIFENLKIKI